MYSVNLYILSRIKDPEILFSFYQFSSRSKKNNFKRNYEQESLKGLVEKLIDSGVNINELDSFFLNYQIPQIGKEFDLLKINDKIVLNIELKSQQVPQKNIEDQLIRNKYYLSHLQQEHAFFTYVNSEQKLYKLDKCSKLQECSIEDLINTINIITKPYQDNLDQLFKISDFLVSPLNTPDKFIDGDYFLTQQQEDYKNQVLKIIENKLPTTFQFISVKGSPGTGKTLLIYDIAKELSTQKKCCLIHCGILSDGHAYLNSIMENLNIISAKEAKELNDFSGYDFIFVDESHRIYDNIFRRIVSYVKKSCITCFWSLDAKQILSKTEKNFDISSKVSQLPGCMEYKLSDKIRTNVELANFIRALFNLKKYKKCQTYTNVNISYANNSQEAKKIIKYYKSLGYIFINYTRSLYNYSSFDIYRSDYNTHKVIGQEFDNVLMVLDKHYYYDADEKLQATTHPCPDYLYDKLLYQGLTRVREKLSIIIIEDENLFRKILSIVV